MKKLILFLFLILLPFSGFAESKTMSATEVLHLAGDLFDRGDFEKSLNILQTVPPLGDAALEIERWFLIGQIASRSGDLDSAIEIYKKILDDQPELARIRFELAVCYLKKEQWYRADYHLRLAMAAPDLPAEVLNMMYYYRYIIRQNKSWNAWFNFGLVPDSNINQGTGGQECYDTEIWGVWCNDSEKIAVTGLSLQTGGDWEFKIDDENWRWKSDVGIYTTLYDLSEYDDLFLMAGTGPRYVWDDGDIWVAGTASRRWYGWDEYNWSSGLKTAFNYDFTRKVSAGFNLSWTNNVYDEYDFLNGNTYAIDTRLFYSIDSVKYINLRLGLTREETNNPGYSNYRPTASIGYGMELLYGFSTYIGADFYWYIYDDERTELKDTKYQDIQERSYSQVYSISLSNNKFDIFDFLPVVTASYTTRDSNVPRKVYDKFDISFTMRQKF